MKIYEIFCSFWKCEERKWEKERKRSVSRTKNMDISAFFVDFYFICWFWTLKKRTSGQAKMKSIVSEIFYLYRVYTRVSNSKQRDKMYNLRKRNEGKKIEQKCFKHWHVVHHRLPHSCNKTKNQFFKYFYEQFSFGKSLAAHTCVVFHFYAFERAQWWHKKKLNDSKLKNVSWENGAKWRRRHKMSSAKEKIKWSKKWNLIKLSTCR